MSAFWNPNEVLDEEDDDDNDGTIQHSGRDGVVFLIDADSTITGNEETFSSCLECIEAVMLNRIISSPKDLVGIVFYNTEHSPPPGADDLHLVVPANIAILQPMQVISKSVISYIKNMRASDDFHDFANRYGSSNSSNFSDALWLCSRMIMGTDYKLQNSTIVLFTNNELPHASDSAEFRKTFIRARDLNTMGVDLMLVPMADKFDDTKFFKELICVVSDLELDEYKSISPIDQKLDLCRRIFRRDLKRSCLRYFTWSLGNGLDIGCGVHCFNKSASKPSPVHLLAETNEVVESKRVFVTKEWDEETSEYVNERRLLPGELRKYQDLGGMKVILTPEELATAKTMMAPGMKLLGFKPLTQLKERCFVKATRLLYPSENQIKGSLRLFRALWERCLARECFAVCVFVQVRKTAPRYVALVPQTEDQNGCDGFRMIYLPMQTDSRNLDVFEKNVPEISEEISSKMQTMIKKLKFKYNPIMFPDPHLSVFYADLESLVYEEPQADYEDSTLPKIEYQDSRIAEIVQDLTLAFGEECAVSNKRTASSKLTGNANAKESRTELIVSKEDILSAITSGAVEKLSVASLKAFLQAEGVKGLSKLKKPELIDLVRSHCHV